MGVKAAPGAILGLPGRVLESTTSITGRVTQSAISRVQPYVQSAVGSAQPRVLAAMGTATPYAKAVVTNPPVSTVMPYVNSVVSYPPVSAVIEKATPYVAPAQTIAQHVGEWAKPPVVEQQGEGGQSEKKA